VPVVCGGAEEGAVLGTEVRQKVTGGGGRSAARAEVTDDEEGRRHMVVLTPEGGKCFGVRACNGQEHTVVSWKAA
jgi:hypothetical protein